MINDKTLQNLLSKAEELKSLFVLGQRILPFLEEIFVFVGEIQPLLDEINNSIDENIKKMPGASKQLSQVTEANEMATTEILDIADGITYKTDILQNNFDSLAELSDNFLGKTTNILSVLYKAIEQGKDLKPVLPEISNTIKLLESKINNDYADIKTKSGEILQTISMDTGSIMMALQVQDITAQQLAAVNSLLNTVQERLSKILNSFTSSGMEQMGMDNPTDLPDDHIQTSQLHREVAFDPDAIESITQKDIRQDNIDEMFNNIDINNLEEDEIPTEKLVKETIPDQENVETEIAKEETIINETVEEKASESTTDKQSEDNSESVENDDNNTEEDLDPMAQFSQDDIDALFGN